MKKLIFSVLLLTSFYGVVAQNAPTEDQKKALFNKLDRLINNYIKYCSFLEPGKSKISPNSLRDFRQLFVSDNINLPDEMSPAYFDNDKSRPLVPSFSTLDNAAAILKEKKPVFKANYTKSLSAMKQYQEALNNYFKDYGQRQVSFYQAYEHLSKTIAEYNSGISHQEDIVTRKLSEFLAKVEVNYPEGFSVRMLNSAISVKNITRNEINVLIEKTTEGKISGAALKLENHDTLLLRIQVSNDYSTVQIAGIEMVGHQLNFLNDKDRDFVADNKDACPADAGMFRLNGCPFPDEKNFETKMYAFLSARIADSLTMVAAQLEANTTTRSLEQQVAVLENKIKETARTWITIGVNGGPFSSTLTNMDNNYLNNIKQNEVNPTTAFSGGASISGDVMLEHYFGVKPTFGIGFGLSYANISGTVKKNSFHVEFQATDKSSNIFRQHITAEGPVIEKASISSFAVPILLLVKTNISEKIGFKIGAGIILNLSYINKMNKTYGVFDYEAVYKYSGNNPTIFDAGQTPDHLSWLITRDFVTSHIGANGVANYFSALQADQYPVGLGLKTPAGISNPTSSATFGSGIGFVVMPSVSYNFNKQSAISLGGYFSSAGLQQSGNGYRLIDETYHYNTLLKGVSRMSNSSFGIRFSYSHSLFYNLPKWIKELSGIR
ncbi:MAG: hypothetical protein ABIS01_11290 [Ferruginibacter sp.]